ncbi:hypothetical protein [Litoribrevibacter albus]|uniref:Uncharacterized protein n=1 Tax=Litoribrevibacter albus TaxID=1473156 RepID=A0AA37SE40_9GAMM|nr:hypothetical protein [Litoribrevibacter albus]GLQ33350.1 hypothetical protein GCM10007876_38300 [Litoribrevibacter albus]
MKKVLCTIVLSLASFHAVANSIVDQWKAGLSGARLTSYSGSAISSNSTLTIINFCRNGRYSYYKEGSWSVPGTAGGASNNTVTGTWDIQLINGVTVLTYSTDRGEQGMFPIYLQNNGRVNIGGAAYAVEQGRSGC